MKISRIKFLTPVLLVGRQLDTVDTIADPQYSVEADQSIRLITITNREGHSVVTPTGNVVWFHPVKPANDNAKAK